MPEREEDDTLNGEELEYRVVRLEYMLSSEVEEEESVEGERDGHVVDDGYVQISALRTET